MNDRFAFFLPACGLLLSIAGAFMLFLFIVAARAERVGSAAELSEEEVADRMERLRSGYAWMRLFERADGPFWFILGLLTLWFSEFRAPWILTAVGLFWMVSGARTMLSRRRRLQQAGEKSEDKVDVAWAPATTPDGRRRLIRRQGLSGALLLALGAPLLWFSGPCVGAAPAAVSPAAEGAGRLEEVIRQQVAPHFARHRQVGLVVGVVAGDEEVLLGFGSRRLGDSNPPDADTPFEIGSITKVFTGILLARRIENGELELDARVADLLPDGWSVSEGAREISLGHCTTHASGLPRLPANLIGFSGAFRSLFGGDPYRDYSEQAFREALATMEIEFEPGTRCLYSNFAVGLLGFALATHANTDYETLVTSEICQPLGMHDTVIAGDPSRMENILTGYRAALGLGPAMMAMKSAEWRLPNHLAGAGGIRSTGRDMLRFLKANMGRLSTPLDPAIRRSQQELFRAEMRMGMNWIHSFRALHSGLPRKVIWHNGGTGGFRTYLGFTEDRQYGVFVLSNTQSDVDTLAVEILKALDQEFSQVSHERAKNAVLDAYQDAIAGRTVPLSGDLRNGG